MKTGEDLSLLARKIRGHLVQMSCRAGTAHLASALSCVDILVAAYWEVLRIDPRNSDDPRRDRSILSKGHAASALYATLALRGFFEEPLLETFNRNGGCLPEQPSPGCVPGIELATGSLGHGLPFGLGAALAGKMLQASYRVLVVMSDGECEEGSVWEAAMMAPLHRLENLCVVVDCNKWQATGRCDTITALYPLADKWKAFGWNVYEVDGHDIGALSEALCDGFGRSGRPSVIVAHTVKGKGVSFMEDNNNWHYRSPTPAEVEVARAELGLV